MRKLRCAFFTALLIFGVHNGAAALTLKSGQVLSPDGQVFDGASPEQQEALIAKSKTKGWFGAEGKKSGVQGSNVYVVVQDELVFVPLKDIQGKSKENITKVIKEHIVDALMANATSKILAKEGSIDAETVERLSELANDPVTSQIAAQIAEDAAGDPAMAEALTEATLAMPQWMSTMPLKSPPPKQAMKLRLRLHTNRNVLVDPGPQTAVEREAV